MMTQIQFQPQWARAAADRPNIAKAEMPLIRAHFDNGANQGEVIVLGLDGAAGIVLVRVPGRPGLYRVEAGSLSVSVETAEHLARETSAIETWTEVSRYRPFLSGGGCRAANFYR